MSTTPKKPADHQPKANAPHSFEAPGVDKNGRAITKRYTLPLLTEAQASKVPGGVTADAIMNPGDVECQTRLILHNLAVSGASDEAKAALRALPTDRMFTIVGEWMGESSGSSD